MKTLYQNRCRNCNAAFRSGAKNTRYCSPKCNILHKTDKSSGCWLWTGARYNQGYGNIRVLGKQLKAHRVSYEEFVGPAGDLLVCHRCDVRLCCNPDHLFLGTPKDNMLDMVSKGRSKTCGPKQTFAVLGDGRADMVRRDPRGHTEIARELGVSARTVALARKRLTYSR